MGMAKIKNRLIGNLDPDEWAVPPIPKGMHLTTYQRYVDRYDRYEAVLDAGLEQAGAQWLGRREKDS
jgi:hypothetical protein